MQRTRDIILWRGWPCGRKPLITAVLRILCPHESRQALLFRDRTASTLLAIEKEMLAELRWAARGWMASLLQGAAKG
jgi:hypothetical protein